MKFLALALGAFGLVGLTLGQGDTTIVSIRTQVTVSLPTNTLPSIPIYRRDEQPEPPTSTPPHVPYSTVTNCHSTAGTSTCWTNTLFCPSGSSTVLQTWMSKDCNWPDMTSTPQPAFTCSTALSTYMACLTTGSIPPFPPMPSRSQRLVAKYAQVASTTTAGPGVDISSTVKGPVPPSLSSDLSGGQSQRSVAQHGTTDLGGRSQRWVAREAKVVSTMDSGGRHNRYLGRVAKAVSTITTPQESCPSGSFGPDCGPCVSGGPEPTTLETALKT
ncbi:Nn.00g078540.m01.CDS01 [Neocucurbitaria sp. VM-36]